MSGITPSIIIRIQVCATMTHAQRVFTRSFCPAHCSQTHNHGRLHEAVIVQMCTMRWHVAVLDMIISNTILLLLNILVFGQLGRQNCSYILFLHASTAKKQSTTVQQIRACEGGGTILPVYSLDYVLTGSR